LPERSKDNLNHIAIRTLSGFPATAQVFDSCNTGFLVMTTEFEGFQTLYAVDYNPWDSTIHISSDTNLVTGTSVFEDLTSRSSQLSHGSTGWAEPSSGHSGETGSFTYVGAVEDDGTYIGILVKIGDNYYLADVYKGGLPGHTNISTRDALTVHTNVGWHLTDDSPRNGPGTPNICCFLADTAIRTPLGDVSVKDLKIGDLITLSDGRTAPVRWLGVHTVSMAFADPLRFLPIRVKAHALGENLPARDLLLSSDHALLVEGLLIQAGALVNGVSIVREHRVPATFTYYHVEVADHSLLLAENLPAETFVDNVDRMAFDNWAEHQALYPDAPSIAEMEYHRAKAHRQVPQAIRSGLLARAASLYGTEAVAAA
jgi:hypothetical protein